MSDAHETLQALATACADASTHREPSSLSFLSLIFSWSMWLVERLCKNCISASQLMAKLNDCISDNIWGWNK